MTGASGRALPSTVLTHIGRSPRSPLWVRLAVDLLADLDTDDFASIADAPDQAQAIADLLTAEAQGLPDDTGGLVNVFLDAVTDRLVTEAASVLLGALAVTRSGLAPADLAALLPDFEAATTVATLRRVLGSQLRETDIAGRLTFSHNIVRTAAEIRAPSDIHAYIVRVLDADAVWDDTDALDTIWHAIHSGAEKASAFVRALNQGPTGTDLTLMQALRSHREGLEVIDAVDPRELSLRGTEALLRAMQTWGPDHLSVKDQIRYTRQTQHLTSQTHGAGSLHSQMWALRNVGCALRSGGDLAGARAAHTQQLHLARKLHNADPGKPETLGELAAALMNVGDVLLSTGDLAGARAAHTEQLSLARAVQNALPRSLEGVLSVGGALERLGVILLATGDLDGARTAHTEQLNLARALRKARPDESEAVKAVAASLDKIGRIAEATGDLDAAHTAYNEQLNLCRELRNARPDAIGPVQNVAVSLDHVGRVLLATGDLEAARDAHTEQLHLARQVRNAQPDALGPLRDVTTALNAMGQIAEAAGDLPTAVNVYTEQLDLSLQLRNAQPDAIEPVREVSHALYNIGRMHFAGGDLDAAHDAHVEQLSLARQLRNAAPDALEIVRDVAAALDNVGTVLSAMGDRTGARDAHVEQLSLARQLRNAQPNAIQPAQDLAHSLEAVARTSAPSDFERQIALNAEVREIRTAVFEKLRDHGSALAWARVNLKLDGLLTEHAPHSHDSEMHAYHRTLVQETKTLLILLNDANAGRRPHGTEPREAGTSRPE